MPFYFPVPQVQIHLLVKLSDYGDRYIAEERIKYIFDFFLRKNMYIFGADSFDFLPVIHHNNPIMYVHDFVLLPIIKMHVPTSMYHCIKTCLFQQLLNYIRKCRNVTCVAT